MLMLLRLILINVQQEYAGPIEAGQSFAFQSDSPRAPAHHPVGELVAYGHVRPVLRQPPGADPKVPEAAKISGFSVAPAAERRLDHRSVRTPSRRLPPPALSASASEGRQNPPKYKPLLPPPCTATGSCRTAPPARTGYRSSSTQAREAPQTTGPAWAWRRN